jgi:protein unc-45
MDEPPPIGGTAPPAVEQTQSDAETEGALELKAQGNAHFKQGDHAAAYESYSAALAALPASGGPEGAAHRRALLSNRAACLLALDRPADAVADCDAVLEGDGGHLKALYRRGQAHEQLGDDHLDDAMKDYTRLLHMDRTNKPAAKAAARVRERLQVQQSAQLQGTTVPGLLARISERKGTDVDASAADLRRLAGLTSDASKAVHIVRERAIPLMSAAGGSSNPALAAPALTVLANVLEAGINTAAHQIMQALPLARLRELARSSKREIGAPASVVLSALASSGISRCPGGIDDATAFEAMRTLVATIEAAESPDSQRIGLECLAKSLVSRPDEPEGRPVDPKKKAMDLKEMAKSLRTAAGLDKEDKRGGNKLKASWRAVEAAHSAGALTAALPCCDTTDGVLRFCALKVLDLLFGASAARCWHDMQSAAGEWISGCLSGETMEDKQQGMAALACIASSARDVALHIAQQDDVLDEVLALAQASKFEEAQLSAAELCAHLASDDPAKCFNPLGGIAALRQLSAHRNARIAVRAVTALAKLASVNATHRLRVLSDGRVASRVITALSSEGEHAEELRSWAVEAMAYLSLYPEVKEPFEETLGIAHLVRMLNTEVERYARADDCDDEDEDGPGGTNGGQEVSGFVARGTTQFGLVSIICNLTSTELTKDEQIRRKLLEQGQEATVEQVEKLRKLSECKDPNDEAFQEPPERLTDTKIIDRMRLTVVAENGVAAILSVMRNNADVSDNTKEMIAKTMANCACHPPQRGLMVQQGVVPLMADIAKCENQLARESAAQTLAKITITTDPKKFRQGAVFDMIVPLLKLTESDEGLHQYEACLALTNLASMSEEVREYMLNHKAFQSLQYLMTVDDHLIMRAATECLCNLVQCDAITERMGRATAAARNELKMFVVLAAEADDYETRRAAAGALASISGCHDQKVLDNLLSEEAGTSYGDVVYVLGEMLTINEEMMHRAVVSLVNLAQYEPAAQRIKGCVLNIQRDSTSEETQPVQLSALLEMVAGGGLSTNDSIVEAAQTVIRACGM